MIVQQIDGVSFETAQAHDFSFLKRFGRVFSVFDDQDSGNICFGVKDLKGRRRFIKYAGAHTKRGSVTPEQAAAGLRETVPLYRDLAHPSLIRLEETFEAEGGFGMVFAWEDGDCMGRMYPEPHARFFALPTEHHLIVFDDLMRFLAHTADHNYVAVDFYDGSVMYDAQRRKTTVCDIDLFRKSPAVNDMGRMWGSSRFMSPEEFSLGAPLDEVTNVYTLGAFAFALFGKGSREREKWILSKEKYRIAAKAVSDERGQRQQSILRLMEEWNTAR